MHRIPLLVLVALALSRGRSRRRAGAERRRFNLRRTDLDLHVRVDARAGQWVKRDVGALVDEANRSPWQAVPRQLPGALPLTRKRGLVRDRITPALDEQRESRGVRRSRPLRWQRDRAAKLITRACPRVIWQSGASFLRARPEYGRPGIGAQRPGQGRGRKRARHGPCGRSARSPAYRRDWGFAYDVSRPSPHFMAPPGYRE
jgi:hypothetical protein